MTSIPDEIWAYCICPFMPLQDAIGFRAVYKNDLIDKCLDNRPNEWFNISRKTTRIAFIRKYHDYINWRLLCEKIELPESLIDEFPAEVEWCYLPLMTEITDRIIQKHPTKICWYCTLLKQYIPDWLIIKYNRFIRQELEEIGIGKPNTRFISSQRLTELLNTPTDK